MLAVAGCCYLRLHSVENPVLDSRQQAWPQVGFGGDGDLVAELAAAFAIATCSTASTLITPCCVVAA